MLANESNKPVLGIDWSRTGVDVYTIVNGRGRFLSYASLQEAAEQHPNSIFVFESSAESFQLQQRQKVLDAFEKHGIEAWTFATKYTARYRKQHKIEKSDKADAKVIYLIATETPLSLHRFGPLVENDPIRDIITYGGGPEEVVGLVEDRFLYSGEITAKMAEETLKKVPSDQLEYFSEFIQDSAGNIRKQVGRFLLVANSVRLNGRGFREFRRQIGNYGNGYGSMARSEFYKWLVQTTTNKRLNRSTLKGLSTLSDKQYATHKSVMKDADKFIKFLWSLTAPTAA